VPAPKESSKPGNSINALRRGPPPGDAESAPARSAPVGRAGQASAPTMDNLLSKPATRPGQGGTVIDPRTGLPR
jgi:hypothetical protein